MNSADERARLLQVQSKQAGRNDHYTFGVLGDMLSKYPQLQSSADYVQSVRHQLEKERLPTVREEFQVAIAGVEFTGAVLQEQALVAKSTVRDICHI